MFEKKIFAASETVESHFGAGCIGGEGEENNHETNTEFRQSTEFNLQQSLQQKESLHTNR